MIQSWAAFACFVLVNLWLAFWCGLPVGFVLLAAALLLVLLSAIFNRAISPHIKVNIELPQSCDKSRTIRGKIVLKNQRFTLYRRAKLNIEIHNMLTDESRFENVNTLLGPKSDIDLNLKFQSRYCGTVCVACDRIRLYDFLGLTWRTVRIGVDYAVTVLPDVFPVDVDVPLNGESMDNESYAEDRCGEDMSEVYDFREYVPGDNVGHIQWKLSEKHGRLIIRRGSFPLDRMASLCMILAKEPYKRSETAELTVSVSQSLCEAGISHEIIIGAEHYAVDNQQDLSALLPKLLTYKEIKLSEDLFKTDNVLIVTADESVCDEFNGKAKVFLVQDCKK